MSKTISFNWAGGKYTQKIKISGTNLPWGYKCDADWVKTERGMTTLDVTVDKTYDFRDRDCVVKIFDKFGNTIELEIKQTGYRDLSVECGANVVIYEDEYKNKPSFDTYITVYGGPTQQPLCKDIAQYFEMVWDNSDSYNDFLFHIPQNVSGTFTIRHSDADAFISYCKARSIPYDESKLEKTITVIQVTKNDKIGHLWLKYDGKSYTIGDKMVVEVDKNEWAFIKILSTTYVRIDSVTKYTLIDNRELVPSLMAQWLTVDNKTGLIKLKAKSTNPFTDRYCTLRLTNKTNSLQFMDITILQRGTASKVD